LWEDQNGMGRACLPWSLLFYFLPAITPRVILLLFPLVSAAIDNENYFKFKWLWY